MTLPSVSVLLPYRDAASTVLEAIESTLEAHADVELLAVNDRSRDEGPSRVRALAERDPRVVPVDNPSSGLVSALNHGLSLARAPLIARMDADDVSLPGRLAAQRALWSERPSLAVVAAQVACVPAGGEGLGRYIAWQNGLLTPEDHARELFVEAPVCHPSVLLRRDALESVGAWRDTEGPEDYDLWLRLDAAGHAFAKVPSVLLQWKQREGRLTFTDPRCDRERFYAAKAPYLARRLRALGRPVAVWGAGPVGKRTARALEVHGVRAERFVDIDPRRIGSVARGAPIVAPEALVRGRHTVLVAVGQPGARDIVKGRLTARGFVEGEDFLAVA